MCILPSLFNIREKLTALGYWLLWGKMFQYCTCTCNILWSSSSMHELLETIGDSVPYQRIRQHMCNCKPAWGSYSYYWTTDTVDMVHPTKSQTWNPWVSISDTVFNTFTTQHFSVWPEPILTNKRLTFKIPATPCGQTISHLLLADKLHLFWSQLRYCATFNSVEVWRAKYSSPVDCNYW